MLDALHKLTTLALHDLASALAEGPMSSGITAHGVQQICGAAMTAELLGCLNGLSVAGWTPKQIAVVVASIAAARGTAVEPEQLLDLVLSGPEVAGIPTRDTAAVMHTLVEEAREEVIIVGYAVHNGRRLFQRLAERMAENADLKVWFCLNIQRKYTDTSLSSEIVRRFGHEFSTKHWPWSPKPEIYYDPRALDPGQGKQTSLHAKCLMVDRRAALVTSANFTEAAQERNIEVGVVVRHAPLVARLVEYFVALRDTKLSPCRVGR